MIDPAAPPQVTVRDRAPLLWAKALAGPAISAMIALVIVLLSWGIRWSLWTYKTEVNRANLIGWMGIALCLMLGLLVWRLAGGKPGRIEITAGPAHLEVESGTEGEPDRLKADVD